MTAKLKRIKRKRGGQKGNQNARKHGFYSSVLNPDEICRFWNILNQERIDPEMAVLRIKLQSIVQQAPANRRLLKEVSYLIVKWSVKKYQLDREGRAIMKAALEDALESACGISFGNPEKRIEMENT